MDFNKLKYFAKTATEKTIDGISKANEARKKASQETKITLPASNGFSSTTTVRKTIEGFYYLGFYSEKPELFEFAGFNFDGSTVVQKTITKGKTEQKGRSGSVIGGAAVGTLIAGPVGTIIGGMAGSSRKKKGTINTTSTTISEEKPGKATLQLRNCQTGEVKTIHTKITQAEANNINTFFMN